LAGGIIALLAITMVLGVQTFDHVAQHWGGTIIFAKRQPFKGRDEPHPIHEEEEKPFPESILESIAEANRKEPRDARVLPLDQLLDGLKKNPSSSKYWWLYALLFSTMIPSLINLMIGGASLLRGIPGLPTILLRFMPSGKAVPQFDRAWIALVLTCQVFLGALLGGCGQKVMFN
jgi:hypothetical protein